MKTLKAVILIIFFVISTICFASVKKYKGTLYKYPIEMIIKIEGDIVEGYYSYNKIGEPIKIEGSLNNNRIKLTEKSLEKTTGYFEARFTKYKINGYWTSPDKSKKLYFELEPVNTFENLNTLIFTKQYKVYNKNTHAEADINLPIIYLPDNKNTENKINKILAPKNTIGYSLTEIKEMHGGSVEWAYYKINILKGNFLSIEINSEYLGNNYINNTAIVNLDINTGEELSGEDLFIRKYKNDLLKKIKTRTEQEISKTRKEVSDYNLKVFDSIISKQKYVLNNLDNCSFTESNIIFEIDYGFSRFYGHLEPNREIKFSYEELKKYLTIKYEFLAL